MGDRDRHDASDDHDDFDEERKCTCCSRSLLTYFMGLDISEGEAAAAEMATYWSVQWPVALSTIARMGYLTVDNAFLGRVEVDGSTVAALAGSSVANLWIYATGASVWRSAGGAVGTLAAQAVGAKKYQKAVDWLLCGLVVSFLAMFPLGALWIFAGDILGHLGFEHREAVNAGIFCQYFAIGLPPTLVIYALNGWLTANRVVRPNLWISVLMLFLNIGLNQLLIFGVGEWKGLGFIGSPLSTALCRWINLFLMLGYLWIMPGPHREAFTGFRLSAITASNMYELAVGQWLPKVAAGTVGEIQTQLMGWLAAQLGPESVAAHSSMQGFFYMITAACYSAATAAGTRVGNHLGAGNPKFAKAVYYMTMWICFFSGIVVSATLLGTHQVLGYIYSPDMGVVQKISQITFIIGCAWILISLLYGSFGSLGGQARAGAVALSMVVSSWFVAVPIAFGLQYGLHKELGVQAMWIAICTGNVTSLIVMTYLLMTSDWKALADAAVKRSEDKKGGGDGMDAALLAADDDDDLTEAKTMAAGVTPSLQAGSSGDVDVVDVDGDLDV